MPALNFQFLQHVATKIKINNKNNWNFAVASPQSGFLSTDSRSNLEMLVFVERGKPENLEKNPRSNHKNQQQTQPTYDTGTRNQTQATLVGGKCSHHCAISPTLAGCLSITALPFPTLHHCTPTFSIEKIEMRAPIRTGMLSLFLFTVNLNSVFISAHAWDPRKREQLLAIYACFMLQKQDISTSLDKPLAMAYLFQGN